MGIQRHSPRLDGVSGFWLIFWFFDLSSKQIHVLVEIVVSTNIGFRQKDLELFLGLNTKVYVSAICQYLKEGLVSELT